MTSPVKITCFSGSLRKSSHGMFKCIGYVTGLAQTQQEARQTWLRTSSIGVRKWRANCWKNVKLITVIVVVVLIVILIIILLATGDTFQKKRLRCRRKKPRTKNAESQSSLLKNSSRIQRKAIPRERGGVAEPASQSKVQTLRGEVDELSNKMKENMKGIIKKGEKVVDLLTRSENMKKEAEDFKYRSKEVESKYCWKNVKLITVIVILIIILLATDGDKESDCSETWENGKSRLQQAHEDVEEVKVIMLDNLQKADERSGKLDDLEDRSVKLEEKSRAFQKTANQVMQKKRWENNKMKVVFIVIGVVAALIIIGLIIFAIVDGTGGN
ncbi:hypothetical protein ABVT39_010758 [Epinephelus coioides]